MTVARLMPAATPDGVVRPCINSGKDNILSFRREPPPEIKERPLCVILDEIAFAWRGARRDQGIREQISLANAHGGSQALEPVVS